MITRYIIVKGSPVAGLQFFGPYMDHDEALTAAEDHDGDWWIAELEGPL